MLNLFRQTKRYQLYVVWVLVIFFVASCGSRERLQRRLTEARPFPAETPAVAYGASLDEWEEATRADNEPTASSTEIDTVRPSPEGDDGGTGEAASASTIGTPFTFEDVVYQEMLWDGLVPPGFTSEAIMAKYDEQLAEIEDGSPEATEIFLQVQEEFKSAPVNELLDETFIRLPGFIAPLDYQDEFITEFLLVPYFGACVHVPPPPVNQTILVRAAEGQGIKAEESFNPIWVMGKLTTDGATTELAAAGYHIQDAIIETYTEP